MGCIKKGKVDYRICYLLYVQAKRDGIKWNVEWILQILYIILCLKSAVNWHIRKEQELSKPKLTTI